MSVNEPMTQPNWYIVKTSVNKGDQMLLSIHLTMEELLPNDRDGSIREKALL